jgi:hypothetical protein
MIGLELEGDESPAVTENTEQRQFEKFDSSRQEIFPEPALFRLIVAHNHTVSTSMTRVITTIAMSNLSYARGFMSQRSRTFHATFCAGSSRWE